ncbi:Tyrosine-protein kinase transforming protein Abl [Trichinella pseudospiralis]|uniref:Tyrosine-protein kinase n=1 Tax=Trichinella pseudospiralis TaxID=6337 RepID=A0A0V1ICD2_TRIPS|nr:Tyrosine-protein kinase transforming protein Abl [Trichinella pseudospiralis]KRZ20492.1 Tyrosine-protein kinase transforming protein Abl [Trichinella pseudospiralis]KRZ35893.1 Tyrosine-protein kinase transforming protein Abl [Trichinella pseudospiralis]
MAKRVLKENFSFPTPKKVQWTDQVCEEKKNELPEDEVVGPTHINDCGARLCEALQSKQHSWMANNSIKELLMNKLPEILKNKPFYHGYLPKVDAEEILKDQPDGSFIVRMTNECGDYSAVALSVKQGKEFFHYMIDVNINGSCFMNCIVFDSVTEMVNYFVEGGKPLDIKSSVYLKTPARFADWQLETHHIVSFEKNIEIGKNSDVIQGVFCYKGKNTDVAIKLPIRLISEDSMDMIFDELRAMRHMKCKYTLKAYGVTSFTCRPILLTEYADRGTLHYHIRTHVMSPYEKLRYCTQIGYALKHLKDKNIIHRNIVVKKCFLFTNSKYELPTVKLGGFRYCISASEEDVKKKIPRKLLFCSAPEAIKDNKWSFESDLWMYSLLMWSIFTGSVYPFREFLDGDPMNLYAHLIQGKRQRMSADILPDVQLIIRQCQETNPSKRGTIEAVLEKLTALLDSYSHSRSKPNDK